MKMAVLSALLFVGLTAQAQVQQTPGMIPGAPAQAQAQAKPTPTATPPVVGMNIDPQPPATNQAYPPANSQPQTQSVPTSLPPLTPEEMQRRIQEQNASMRGVQVQRQRTTNGPSFPVGTNPGAAQGVEANQPKSEIIAVLPPAQRAAELKAVLRTSVGDITIKLDRANAPHTVDYFTGLAKGEVDFTDIKTSKPVKRPFYNGLIFHRVVKNTLIQTGDPFGNGRGNSGQTIQDELKPTMKFDRPGLVAMAPMRDSNGTGIAKGSNSSQFFITLREMPEWNGQFTIFGEVEDGLDVVQKIANSKVGPTERPIKRIYLVAVDIIEAGQ